MHTLRKKLLRNNSFNPFHDEFNTSDLLNELNNFDPSDKDEETLQLAITYLSAVKLHPYYKHLYNFIKENINESGLSIDELIHSLISFANRNYIIVSHQLFKSNEDSIEHNYTDIFGSKVESIDPSIGKLDAGRAIETTIDATQVIINFAEKLKNEFSKIDLKENDQLLTNFQNIIASGSFLYLLKAEYDNCIWNNGFINYLKNKNKFLFDYPNQNELVLKKIGFYRLHLNSENFSFFLRKRLQHDSKLFDSLKKQYYKKKQAKQIKDVTVKAGYIEYTLAKGINNNEVFEEAEYRSELLAYYDFIENVKLPLLDNIDLNDLITLLLVTQNLFKSVAFSNIGQNSINVKEDFYRIPFRIKIYKLKKYLIERTNFSILQITKFINLLINEENKRINFWDHPFQKIGTDLLCPLLCIISPLPYHLLDTWLEKGGFKIDERGIYFEKHIKKNLAEALKEKKFFFNIPLISEFKTKNRGKEEIDLIVNLKNILIIAEVKCIKYPMEARDSHNAYNRLKRGSEQVVKKTKFILDNFNDFKSIIGEIENKEIINLVITNYPIFTGFQIDGIPVVDFYLLNSYVETGKFTNVKRTSFNGKVISDENVNEDLFYKDETEFCANFKNYMINPPAVEKIKPLIEVTEQKFSLGNEGEKMFVTAANFKESQ